MPPDMDLILSVNAGSSSLKLSLFKFKSEDRGLTLLVDASISNISTPHPSFKAEHLFEDQTNKTQPDEKEISSHHAAFQYFLSYLKSNTSFDLASITHLCHRVVHGGTYTKPTLITDESYHHIEDLSDLAPLHNAAALSVIKSCLSLLPSSKSIAFFDTSFHTTLPPHVYTYPISQAIAAKKGIRKYGFHGLSYSFVLNAVSTFLSKPSSSLTLIILHLGSGASMCAIKRGISIDTTMGLTPLDGLPGATRSGSVDPSLIFHYLAEGEAGRMSRESIGQGVLHLTEAERILNKESGWKSLTGTTDFGQIVSKAIISPPPVPSISSTTTITASEDTISPETLAFHIFLDRILTFLGSYILKLGGPRTIDAIVFTGGIGERSVELRREVMKRCVDAWDMFAIDESANEGVAKKEGTIVCIGNDGMEGKPKTLVCRTDEQYEMARQLAADGIAV